MNTIREFIEEYTTCIIAVLFILLVYVITSFVLLEFNPLEWSIVPRGINGFFYVIIIVIAWGSTWENGGRRI